MTKLTSAQEAAQEQKALDEPYPIRVLKGLDEEGNVISGGKLGMSISSRLGLAAARGNRFAKFACWALGIVQPNHCVLAEASDLAQARAVMQAEEQSPDLPEGNNG